MSWKNWPGWLKGGLIGIGYLILFSVISFAIIGIIAGYTAFGIPVTLGFPWSYLMSFIVSIYSPYGFGNGDLSSAGPYILGGMIGIVINGFIIGAVSSVLISAFRSSGFKSFLKSMNDLHKFLDKKIRKLKIK